MTNTGRGVERGGTRWRRGRGPEREKEREGERKGDARGGEMEDKNTQAKDGEGRGRREGRGGKTPRGRGGRGAEQERGRERKKRETYHFQAPPHHQVHQHTVSLHQLLRILQGAKGTDNHPLVPSVYRRGCRGQSCFASFVSPLVSFIIDSYVHTNPLKLALQPSCPGADLWEEGCASHTLKDTRGRSKEVEWRKRGEEGGKRRRTKRGRRRCRGLVVNHLVYHIMCQYDTRIMLWEQHLQGGKGGQV